MSPVFVSAATHFTFVPATTGSPSFTWNVPETFTSRSGASVDTGALSGMGSFGAVTMTRVPPGRISFEDSESGVTNPSLMFCAVTTASVVVRWNDSPTASLSCPRTFVMSTAPVFFTSCENSTRVPSFTSSPGFVRNLPVTVTVISWVATVGAGTGSGIGSLVLGALGLGSGFSADGSQNHGTRFSTCALGRGMSGTTVTVVVSLYEVVHVLSSIGSDQTPLRSESPPRNTLS
ncbi:hypothetical protein MT355_15460 [Rathayibacter sp. VKM Ac-2929]|uniref:hypothetical protein n=1 Tax=Rathayibacter sp. VKM Ac-2929 TaxID=2929480 RepID=UPI001FB209B2|nr:hypothetical protein [Rathayibacter sp. VKM Ac-2929]MCJ1674656.1 hypothetical protein [Rathayibacter sp. VKM Ac-2929]